MIKYIVGNQNNKAFTMIELIVTLSIFTILVIAAIPGFKSIIQKNRTHTITDTLISHLHFSKRESISRAIPVSICPVDQSKNIKCGDASKWGFGWVIFLDPNATGVLNQESDKLLLSDNIPQNISINTTIGRITFMGTGTVSIGNGTITLLPQNCGNGKMRIISVTPVGKISAITQSCV